MKQVSLYQHDSETNTMSKPAVRALIILLIPTIAATVFLILGNLTGVIYVLILSFLGFIFIGPRLLKDFREYHDQKMYSDLLKSQYPISAAKAHEVIQYFNATVLRVDSRKGMIQVLVNGEKYTMNVINETAKKAKKSVNV